VSKAWQPNSLDHSRLFDDERSAGFERRDETAADLETLPPGAPPNG
jgi:hypothetical protein